MSGHSHWAAIKHKKKAVDAKKGKVFSRISKYIMTAARDGGGDPGTNLKLQYAIEEARGVNMPRENIDRAIKRGTGDLPGMQLENAVYEGYGPNGVAIMVEVITDNRNRTTSEIRKIFDTKGGRLGETNSVSWLFERKGFFTLPADAAQEDQLLSLALDAGAEDAELVGEVFEITCHPKDFEKVKTKLIQGDCTPKSAEITYVPKSYIPIADQEKGRKILGLMEALEEYEDTQNVYANFDLPDEILAASGKNKA